MRGAFIAVDTLAALTQSGDLSAPLARGVIAKDDISLLGDLLAAKSAAPRPHKTVFSSPWAWRTPISRSPSTCSSAAVSALPDLGWRHGKGSTLSV